MFLNYICILYLFFNVIVCIVGNGIVVIVVIVATVVVIIIVVIIVVIVLFSLLFSSLVGFSSTNGTYMLYLSNLHTPCAH